jgi:hypothetical protein
MGESKQSQFKFGTQGKYSVYHSIHALDANVAVTTHIPGILIVVFDGLSRNVSPATQRLQRIQRCQQRIDVIYPPFV